MTDKEKLYKLCELQYKYSHGLFNENADKKEMELAIVKIASSILNFNHINFQELELLKNTMEKLNTIITIKD
jgi:hypothetical protein